SAILRHAQSVPGGRIRRRLFNGFLGKLKRAARVSKLRLVAGDQSRGQFDIIRESPSPSRLEADSLVEGCDSLVQAAFQVQGLAKLELGIGVVRLEAYGLASG